MRIHPAAFSLALLVVGLVPGCGDEPSAKRGAGEIPDESIVPPSPPPQHKPVAQGQGAAMTIVPKANGMMTSIELYVARLSGSGNNDMVLTLQLTAPDGAPDPAAVLATVPFSSSQAGPNFNWLRVQLPQPVSISANVKLAVVVHATGAASLKWGATANDAYPGGSAFASPAPPAGPWEAIAPPVWDLGLKTYKQG